MATAGKKILDERGEITVKRYLSSMQEPFYQVYELKFHDELTVLDALNMIKDEQDGGLTYRWSCRMGICGSCGAMVNGKPVLMCQTYLKDVGSPIRVEPLRNFPVIKDLVVDIDDPFEKMSSVNPYIEQIKRMARPQAERETEQESGSASSSEVKRKNQGEHIQTPEQLEKLKQTSQCIKCMLCYSACPVYGFDKKFIGPAAGALAYRYNADSRDQSQKERTDAVIGKDGVWGCSFVGECSAVCPKRVDPALALQRLKLMGALRLGKKAVKS